MTTHISTRIAPVGDESPPRCYLSGPDHDIPVIEFGEFPGEATITLGNHRDPVAWLRRHVAELSDFADAVEQALGVTL